MNEKVGTKPKNIGGVLEREKAFTVRLSQYNLNRVLVKKKCEETTLKDVLLLSKTPSKFRLG